MNQNLTPLYTALKEHQRRNPISYHVPGHKNGAIFHPAAMSDFHTILGLDATELSGLDDLHAPEGAIQEAEGLLAAFYGAVNSYFLVNGSTAGNLAMILAACREGDTVLVQRNCHKSILNGLMLAKVKPVFIQPSYHEEWGIPGGLDTAIAEQAVSRYPEARALILTYPTYYGEAGDIQSIVDLAHEHHMLVLVDEAHGAHFVLPGFPVSAIEAGADYVVQSAHKTLPAMTMGSYLHANRNADRERLEYYLQALQSSSPSYPIMASLDLARAYAASFTRDETTDLLIRIRLIRSELSKIKGLRIFENSDPLKLTVHADAMPEGYKLQLFMEEKGLFPELADPHNVLFVLPLLKKNTDYPFEQLAEVLSDIAAGEPGLPRTSKKPTYFMQENVLETLGASYQELSHRPTAAVSIEMAAGCLAAEQVIPYPPGIPLIMPGESVTKEKAALLASLLESGMRFQGGCMLTERKLLVYM